MAIYTPGTIIQATYTATGVPPSAPISIKTSFVSNSLAGSLQFTGGATSHSAPYLSLVPGISIAGGAYTVEGWFQLPNFTQAYGLMGANASAGMSLFVVSNTAFTTDSYGGLGQRTYTVPTMLPNVWYYFALTRNAGQTETLFIGSATSTLAYKATGAAGGTNVNGGQQTNTLNYGANPTNDIGTYYGQAWPGYLTNIRATVGTSVYDPTQPSIPVPNAPLAVVTNTQYLMLGSSVTGDASGTQTVTNHSVTTSALKPLLTTVIGNPMMVGAVGTYTGSLITSGLVYNLDMVNYSPTTSTWTDTVNSYSFQFFNGNGTTSPGAPPVTNTGTNQAYFLTTNTWWAKCQSGGIMPSAASYTKGAVIRGLNTPSAPMGAGYLQCSFEARDTTWFNNGLATFAAGNHYNGASYSDVTQTVGSESSSTWYYVSVSYDTGNGWTLYVNGRLVGTSSTKLPSQGGTTPVIGATQTVPGFNGNIAAAHAYNRTLTPVEHSNNAYYWLTRYNGPNPA